MLRALNRFCIAAPGSSLPTGCAAVGSRAAFRMWARARSRSLLILLISDASSAAPWPHTRPRGRVPTLHASPQTIKHLGGIAVRNGTTTRRSLLAGLSGAAVLGTTRGFAQSAAPVTLNIIDVAGNLQL